MDDALLKDIKFNCGVSDAQYWGYFSICGLLMRYRDLFRSEMGLRPWSEISREEIAEWIQRKESRWPELETGAFRELTVDGRTCSPFDIEGINGALRPRGFIYGAGYGMYMKPTFFLAELRSVRELSGMTVYTSQRELVRDLFTAPGMVRGNAIFLRLEPLMVLLSAKFSELDARRGSAAEDAFVRYGFRHRQIIDEVFEKRLEIMTERYADVLLTHEVAEALEDVPAWKDVLAAAGDRNVEHFLRAVKDLVADTSVHGPLKRTIDMRDQGGLSLTVALMEGYRRLLFPELKKAYERSAGHDDWAALETAREEGRERFLALRERILGLYRLAGRQGDFVDGMRPLIGSVVGENSAGTPTTRGLVGG